MDDSELKIREARKTLLEDYPFFGYHALRLKIEEVKIVPVTATDGKRLMYNKDGLKGMTRKEMIFLAAHETLHVCSGHCLPSNREGKDPVVYNAAADFWINAQLKRANLGDMPQGKHAVLYDPKYDDYKRWDTDAIYRDLKDQIQKQQKDSSDMECGICQLGETKDGQGNTLSKAEEEEIKADIEQANIEAEKLAKSVGKTSGVEEVVTNAIKHPPVDCWERLRRFVSKSVTPNGLTWSKPNKRMLMEDLYLPGVLKEGLGTVCIAVDTSGSITQDQLDSDTAHIKHILSQHHPERIIVIYCDDSIGKVEEFGPYDDFLLKAIGRGGTAFGPPFVWLRERSIRPACLIYFTDLCGPFDGIDPEQDTFPVIWGWHRYGSYGTAQPPVGEVVEIF